MTAHRNPLYVVGQTPRARHRLLKPAQAPAIDRIQEALTLATTLLGDRAHRLADPPPRKLAADALLSAAGETSTTPAPRRQPSSPAGAALGEQGAGVGRHLYAVECQVVTIDQLRDVRARRLARERRGPTGRPTGGRAA